MAKKYKILVSTPNQEFSVKWHYHHFNSELANQANVTFCGKGYDESNINKVQGSFDWIIGHPSEKTKSAFVISDIHKTAFHDHPVNIVDFLNFQKWDMLFMRSLHITHPDIAKTHYVDNLKIPHALLLWSLDHEIFGYSENKDIDICFIGVCGKEAYPIRHLMNIEINAFCAKNNYKLLSGGMTREAKRDITHLKHYYNSDLVNQYKVGKEYVKALKQSKIMLTCSSKYRIPVKKYFEAMATGCLLLADKPHHWQDIGLIDGENFVEINRDNWQEKARYYLANNAERTRMIRNARKLFEAKHTNKIRVKQMLEALK